MEYNNNTPKLSIVNGTFKPIQENDLALASMIMQQRPMSQPSENHPVLYLVDDDGNRIE